VWLIVYTYGEREKMKVRGQKIDTILTFQRLISAPEGKAPQEAFAARELQDKRVIPAAHLSGSTTGRIKRQTSSRPTLDLALVGTMLTG